MNWVIDKIKLFLSSTYFFGFRECDNSQMSEFFFALLESFQVNYLPFQNTDDRFQTQISSTYQSKIETADLKAMKQRKNF